jgi:HEAT repeat protein
VTLLQIVLIFAAAVVGAGIIAVLVWLLYSAYLAHVERSLARRKGLYRDVVAGMAARERSLLEPELHQLQNLRDFEAIEALLEEQARNLVERPAWLVDAYDRLGLVDKYIERLGTARKWRERAFAAELLGRVGNAKAVPALLETIQATRSEDADVREIALRGLARIADPRAIEPLIEALKQAESWLAPRIADILVRHGDPVIEPMLAFLRDGQRHPARAWAANILGELKAQRAFPALVVALKDLDDEVRAKSAAALGKLGDRRAVTYLLDHLLSDPAPFVRARIASALGQFADNEVIDRLVRALGDPAWWVRMRSVEALEQIGAAAEAPLLVALDDPDPEIRIRAAVALERLGVPARLVATIERGEATGDTEELLVKFGVAGARELLAEQLHHPSARVRLAVITAIRRAGRADLGTELIATAREDQGAEVRALALDALLTLRIQESVPVALDLLGDDDNAVRASATRLLGDLGGSEVAGVIQPRTADRDPQVRAAAARALGLVHATTAEREFTRLLQDPDADVRAAAAEGVAEAGWAGSAPMLAGMLADPSGEVRTAAARSLGRLKDPATLPALLRAFEVSEGPLADAIMAAVAATNRDALSEIAAVLLSRGDVGSRVRLVQTVGGLKTPHPLPLLETMAGDAAPGVRAATAEVLGRIPTVETTAILTRALEDPDDTVRARAVDGLVRQGREEVALRLLTLLREDPSPLVRERAALATGLFHPPGGEVALLDLSLRDEPLAVRAAAVLGLGAYDQESLVARVLEMADETELRDLLRERLKQDAEFRLLGLRLRDARHVELRALGSTSREQMEQTLAEGMRGLLSPTERVRLVAGLRAFQGERSRSALLAVVRSDPNPEVRASALTAVAGMLDSHELHLIGSRALSDPHKSVRHAAVALFQRLAPEKGLPGLLRLLRADEDPLVLQAVAEQAEAAFPAFLDLALGLDHDGDEAVLIARVARYIHHPEMRRIVGIIARSKTGPVREAVTQLWAARPDLADESALEGLATDPAVPVRLGVVSAWGALRRFDRVAAMLGDPDPAVRRQIARACLDAPDTAALEPLYFDPDESVRAALFATRLLRGEWSDPPGAFGISPAAAREAVAAAMAPELLRDIVRNDRDPARRQPAALALAVLRDEAAYTVMRTDPVWAVRDRVSRMLAGGQDSDDARQRA